MSKTKRRAILSGGYWFGSHSLGLLVHPYQSMRRIVRERGFRPLVWLPSVCLGCWWIIGVVVAHFNVLASLGLGFWAMKLERFGPTEIVLAYGWLWIGVSLVLWQVLLGYLYARFRGVVES